jgi:NADPH-dependent ferric siderophore reductase
VTDTPTHLAEVLQVRRLSPSLVRVVLGGDGLRGVSSLEVPDEGCVVEFPPVDEPGGDPVPDVGRWYTVRRFDAAAGTVTLDLVVHPGGVGGEWAAVAEPGHRLRLVNQGSWYAPPADARWQLLLGDVVALPAFGRIVEETAAVLPTTVVVELPDPADAQDLPGADVTWLSTPRLAADGSVLGSAVRSLVLPEGPGYVYVAGEAAATRAVRKYLRHELGLPSSAYKVIGYWRVDGKEWNRRFADSGVDLAAVFTEVQEQAGDDPDIALDLYEERLDEVGLL